MTFTQYLKTKLKDNNAIGDLARDRFQDSNWPMKSENNLKELITYLENRGAIDNAIDALKKTFNEYQLSEEFSNNLI